MTEHVFQPDYRQLFNHLAESILVIDHDYVIREANAAFCLSYGIERHDAVDRCCYAVTHGYQCPCWQKGDECPVKKLKEGSAQSHRVLHRHLHADGQARWEEICATRYCPDADASPLIIEELRDVTEMLKTRELLDQLKKDFRLLEGLLPICAACHKIRDDRNEWHPLEEYLSDHTDASFTHSLCSACARKLYPGFDLPA